MKNYLNISNYNHKKFLLIIINLNYFFLKLKIALINFNSYLLIIQMINSVA